MLYPLLPFITPLLRFVVALTADLRRHVDAARGDEGRVDLPELLVDHELARLRLHDAAGPRGGRRVEPGVARVVDAVRRRPAVLEAAAVAVAVADGARARPARVVGRRAVDRVSLYNSTFSRNVWRLYGGAKGLTALFSPVDRRVEGPRRQPQAVRLDEGRAGLAQIARLGPTL
jgi:hypothetical protein